jgi:hypothetical protein
MAAVIKVTVTVATTVTTAMEWRDYWTPFAYRRPLVP